MRVLIFLFQLFVNSFNTRVCFLSKSSFLHHTAFYCDFCISAQTDLSPLYHVFDGTMYRQTGLFNKMQKVGDPPNVSDL